MHKHTGYSSRRACVGVCVEADAGRMPSTCINRERRMLNNFDTTCRSPASQSVAWQVCRSHWMSVCRSLWVSSSMFLQASYVSVVSLSFIVPFFNSQSLTLSLLFCFSSSSEIVWTNSLYSLSYSSFRSFLLDASRNFFLSYFSIHAFLCLSLL